MTLPKPEVDTEWFNEMIAQSAYKSQRALAKAMRTDSGKPLEPSALSLMLRGEREIKKHEYQQLAKLLDVPLVEVLKRCGFVFEEEPQRSEKSEFRDTVAFVKQILRDRKLDDSAIVRILKAYLGIG